MTKNEQPTPIRSADDTQQLSLLPTPDRAADNPRFRLGKATCERGLRHVAEIKEMLAERQRERELASVHHLPPRRQRAA
jgi:hypothetical protein